MAKPVVGVEASDLAALQRDLKKADAAALRLFRDAFKKGGDIIANDARNRIEGVSPRIAGTIRVLANNRGVQVKAGGAKAPHAAAMENMGKEGTFRHPVYGHRDRWVAQQAHPYLLPALVGKEDDVVDAVLDALDAIMGQAGFK